MLGDNIFSLKKLPDNSIDSVVTDPPYGLSFMNKKWDYDVPSVEFWKEVYRVLKPGGHILSFGGTRTYHRMVVNIEDAGFEIRDQIMWLYGSGFPKSFNIGKAVDKMGDITKGTSPYEGWGTALKPANEPICVARKPLSEKSVAENVIKWGTGGINIDGCRIDLNGDDTSRKVIDNKNEINIINSNKIGSIDDKWKEGRFPANLIFECICDEVIKGERGEVKETQPRNKRFDPTQHNSKNIYESDNTFTTKDYNDKGDTHTNPDCLCRMLDEQSVGSSRFFYNAKVSKSERNMGLDGFEEKVIEGRDQGQDERNVAFKTRTSPRANTHPTVKPINLMTYLCRLVTPENGIVLDPFMGSGSTGISAQLEGFRFCGMEMDEDYFKIAEARINSYESYRKFVK